MKPDYKKPAKERDVPTDLFELALSHRSFDW